MNPIKSIKERQKGYVIRNFSKSKYAKKLKLFHNIYRGETCFIIGNGPSLKAEDLEMIYQKGIPTFAFNRIYLMFDKTQWRPTYYISQDEKTLRIAPKKSIKWICRISLSRLLLSSTMTCILIMQSCFILFHPARSPRRCLMIYRPTSAIPQP